MYFDTFIAPIYWFSRDTPSVSIEIDGDASGQVSCPSAERADGQYRVVCLGEDGEVDAGRVTLRVHNPVRTSFEVLFRPLDVVGTNDEYDCSRAEYSLHVFASGAEVSVRVHDGTVLLVSCHQIRTSDVHPDQYGRAPVRPS